MYNSINNNQYFISPYNNNWNASWGYMYSFPSPFSQNSLSANNQDFNLTNTENYDAELKTEINNEIFQKQTLIEKYNKKIDYFNKKRPDGSTVIEKEAKSTPTADDSDETDSATNTDLKGGWAGSCGSAAINLGKSIIGYDENGKFQPKQLATNILTLGVFGAGCFLCPALAVGMAAAGVVTGVANAIKGAKEVDNSTNAIERNAAQQKVWTGVFTGLGSLLGLKGMGRAISNSSKVTGMGASLAKARTSLSGKVIQQISQTARDITVNSYKASKQTFSTNKKVGLWKSLKNKINETWNKGLRYKNRYQKQYDKLKTDLEAKKMDLETKLQTENDPTKQQLLQKELELVKNNLKEIDNISSFKNQQEFVKLKETNSGTKNIKNIDNSSCANIDSKTFNKFKLEMKERQNAYDTELKKLVESKQKQMKELAKKPDKNKTELDEYTSKKIRERYNTQEKLDKGIENLTKDIEKTNKAIKQQEKTIGKILKDRNLTYAERHKRILELNNKIQIKKIVLNDYQKTLDICNNIKFKNKYNPMHWRKNEYSINIETPISNKITTGYKFIKNTANNPYTIGLENKAIWLGEIDTSPIIPGKVMTLSNKERTNFIKTLEEEKTKLEEQISNLNNISSRAEWTTYQSQNLQDQVEAQAQAQN